MPAIESDCVYQAGAPEGRRLRLRGARPGDAPRGGAPRTVRAEVRLPLAHGGAAPRVRVHDEGIDNGIAVRLLVRGKVSHLIPPCAGNLAPGKVPSAVGSPPPAAVSPTHPHVEWCPGETARGDRGGAEDFPAC